MIELNSEEKIKELRKILRESGAPQGKLEDQVTWLVKEVERSRIAYPDLFKNERVNDDG